MTRPSAPLAACGIVLCVLALITLARPRADARVQNAPEAAPAQAPPVAGSEQRQRLLSEEPIDVNAATADELQLLPRIGPTLAERIIDEREHGGRFDRVESLTRVRGIGPRTLERLRPLVMVRGGNPQARLAP